MTRICKVCGIEKQLCNFTVHHREGGGVVFYRHKCRDCTNAVCKIQYRKSDLYKKRQKEKAEREQKYEGLTRKCTKCGMEKNLSEFPIRSKKRSARCYACLAEQQRAWNHRHKKQKRAIARKSYVKKDRFLCALRQSDAMARRNSHVPCSATVEEIRAAFTGRCQNAGCQIPESECHKRLALEHDHETGKFRGWLCHQCNISLGLLKDDVQRVRGLANYLEQSKVVVL